ncbi:hypothetical protein [Labrys neptuniae]
MPGFLAHLFFSLAGIVVASLVAALSYLGVMAVLAGHGLEEAGDLVGLIGALTYLTMLVTAIPALSMRALAQIFGWRAPWSYMVAAAIIAAGCSANLIFGIGWLMNPSLELAGVALGFGTLGAFCGLVFWLIAVRLPARLLQAGAGI